MQPGLAADVTISRRAARMARSPRSAAPLDGRPRPAAARRHWL